MKIIYDLVWRIRNRDMIARVPTTYRSTYDVEEVSDVQWHVLIKYGARDPAGIARAMRKHKCASIEELVGVLKYYVPERKPWSRLFRGIGRLWGGKSYDPHAQQISTVFRNKTQNSEIIARVESASRRYRNKE